VPTYDLEVWIRKRDAYRRRRELRDRAVAHLGGRCSICGYDRCPSAFDFHHVDQLTKDFNISDAMTSWERIVPELEKCVLLCATCHREVHDGLHPEFLDLDGMGARSMYDYDDEIDLLES